MSLVKKLSYSLLITLTLLAVMELISHLAPSPVEKDYLLSRGFSDQFHHWVCLNNQSKMKIYQTNPSFMKILKNIGYNKRFTMPKPKDELRIFLFGGSSAAGGIYTVKGNLSQQLQVRLNDIIPHKKVRVISGAVEGYGSERVLNVLRQAVKFEPDLFVIYSGHNDVGERVFKRRVLGNQTSGWMHSILSYSRFYTILRFIIIKKMRHGSKKMHTFLQAHHDAMKQLKREENTNAFQNEYVKALNGFKRNFNTMCRVANKNNIPLIFVTVIPNERDWEPPRPLTAPGARLKELYAKIELMVRQNQQAKARHFIKNLAVEGAKQSAAAYFCKAKLAEKIGDYQWAKEMYRMAAIKDMSLVMPRTTRDFNECIRQVRRAYKGVYLLDAEKLAFEKCAPFPPGVTMIFDGCHPRLETFEWIADLLCRKIVDSKILAGATFSNWTHLKSDEAYRRLLGITPHFQAQCNIRMAQKTLKLSFPLNTFAVYYDYLRALQLEPENQAAQKGLNALKKKIENN